MKKIQIFLAVCLLFLVDFLFASSKSLNLGGKNGWNNIEKMEGVATGKGRFGYPSIQLKKNSPEVSDFTDMLLHFEDSSMIDSTGNYRVSANDFIFTDDCAFGNGAALSRGTGRGMLLEGRKGTMFGSGGRIGSFSIEFWLAPSIAENGERFFSWRSSKASGDYPVYQTITATFFNNHIEWRFANVFEGYAKNNGEVLLAGTTTIIPDTWTRHCISYNEENGLLEYTVNGITEALEYLTSTGHEGGDIFQMVLGVPAAVSLCPQFTGRVDDFRIEKKMSGEAALVSAPNSVKKDFEKYRLSGGKFITKPIYVMQGSVLNSIDAIMDVPEQTAVQLYIRGGDNYFGWTDSEPAWIPVEIGTIKTKISGSFFQFAAELLPDGGGTVSPSITQITLNYNEVSPPLPPFFVKAEPGDSSVKISWAYSTDETAGGYYIYYGRRPGEYLGRFAAEGPSPLNVGKANSVTLTGLENGSLYYFAIAAYSGYDERVTGPLSKEVFARPKRK